MSFLYSNSFFSLFSFFLYRTNNGRMLPVVFWRVMDDQNGLVVDDQQPSTPNFTGGIRHSGYQPMSGTYDM